MKKPKDRELEALKRRDRSMKGRPGSIEERCRDLAVELMDNSRWDPEGHVPAVLWRAADEIVRLRRKVREHA